MENKKNKYFILLILTITGCYFGNKLVIEISTQKGNLIVSNKKYEIISIAFEDGYSQKAYYRIDRKNGMAGKSELNFLKKDNAYNYSGNLDSLSTYPNINISIVVVDQDKNKMAYFSTKFYYGKDTVMRILSEKKPFP